MKKWLLPTVLLLSHISVFAQQTDNSMTAQQIFEEAYKHLYGLGRSYDPGKAIQMFRQAADRGNAAATNALGNLYAKGEAGLEENITAAIEYYKKAGKAGYGNSYYNLATLYRDGKTLPQDFNEAFNYSKAGAAINNNGCKNLLAYLYFKGFGIQQSYANAFSLYKPLAEAGDVNAQYFTGLCYRNGYGTAVNQDEAKRWLQKAASKGDYQAMHELTAEPQPENSSIISPALQQKVEALKKYEEKLIAASTNDISGIYKGYAVYYDFSRQFVHEIVPLALTLKQTPAGYQGTWTEGDTLAAAVKGSFKNNIFSFDTGSQYIRRNYYSYRDAEKYQFKEAGLSIKYIKDSMYLAGNMQFYSLSRQEPGQPMYIVLGKKVEGNGELPISNLQLTISPNPSAKEVKVTFTLAKPGKIDIEILSTEGKPMINQVGETFLPAGTYTYPISVQHLVKGSYTLRLSASTGATQSKIFIKL